MNSGENSKDAFYTIVEKAKQTVLSEQEKTALFRAIDTYVERNPLQVAELEASQVEAGANGAQDGATQQRGFTLNSLIPSWNWNMYSMRYAAAFLVLVVLGGGTSLAAQHVLPDSFLYPVRVDFNEEIKSAFLFGTEKSQYEVERIQNRLAEVKQLTVENRLTDSVKTKVAAQLDTHTENIQKDLAVLNDKGDYKAVFEISSDLENSLAQNQTDATIVDTDIVRRPYEVSVMARQNAEDQILARDTNDDDAKTIALAKSDAVKSALDAIQANPAAMSVMSVAAAPAPAMMMKTSAKLAAPLAVSASPKGVEPFAATTTISTSTIDSRLKVAKELFAEGQTKLSDNQYNDAFALFKEAYSITLTIQLELDSTKANDSVQTELDNINLDVDVNDATGTVSTIITSDDEVSAIKSAKSTKDTNVLKATVIDAKPVKKIILDRAN